FFDIKFILANIIKWFLTTIFRNIENRLIRAPQIGVRRFFVLPCGEWRRMAAVFAHCPDGVDTELFYRTDDADNAD
ncbi:MAG: hypothetical protein J6X32_03790, partial [Salinivirgaceae bacterium]|nr:hypothetical protein [Salinivirgaceae bacterium]